MDLLDFSHCTLYFEEPLPPAAEGLLALAARDYGKAGAEMALLRAYLLVPDSLTVLVGLYRYYFYQHRLEEALLVAERAMQLAGRHLSLPPDWRALDETCLGPAAANSFGLLRFYLLALKAASVVLLRLGRSAAARDRLRKLAALDHRDQFGATRLLAVVDAFEEDEERAVNPLTALNPLTPTQA
ncbi:hypothetical protein [Accumulibacter sp.]|uniref:hypothetical protein n=1 Tax=Accumulibacter sp. TaxID=2053492 RepID=UPI0025FB4BC6|nr:hypothetical protein [Accumulibacter sp.]MCP5229937.1 hypothetical protein [Accumulibacter sp.]